MSENVQKMMREYETVGVLAPDLDDATLMGAIEKLRAVLNNQGGKVVKVSHFGRKKLAYDIGQASKGVYVQFHYVAPHELPRELERNMRLMDSVIRFETHRLKDNVLADAYEAETDEAFQTALQVALTAVEHEEEVPPLALPTPTAGGDDDDDDFIESQMEPVDDGSDSN